MPVVGPGSCKLLSAVGDGRDGPRTSVLHDAVIRAQLQPIIGHAVASAFCVDGRRLTQISRGPERLALARQVAIYLARTTLQLTLHEAGRMFGRDRSTAAHGCARVEDLRDQPRFDRAILLIETIVQVFRRLGEIAR